MKYWNSVVVFGLFAVGCSNLESHQDKMKRYQPHRTNLSSSTYFSVEHFEFSNISSKRAPASMEKRDSEHALGESNKKLYFKTLYKQYSTLLSYFPNLSKNEINSCPHFHSIYIENKGISIPTKTVNLNYDVEKLNDPKYVEAFPELYLKIAQDETVLDEIRKNPKKINSKIEEALSNKLATISGEIKELCQHGVSDNYYIFENLYSHITTNKFDASKENLNILLKTTVFYNQALINSVNKKQGHSRSIASDDSQLTINDVVNRFKVDWSREYYKSLK